MQDDTKIELVYLYHFCNYMCEFSQPCVFILQALMAQCSAQVKPVSLELGGLAPMIVFDTANIADMVKGTLFSKYRNCGQTCISPQNFFIQEGL